MDLHYTQYHEIELVFHWDVKFVDCPTNEMHEIKCPANKKGFTETCMQGNLNECILFST